MEENLLRHYRFYALHYASSNLHECGLRFSSAEEINCWGAIQAYAPDSLFAFRRQVVL